MPDQPVISLPDTVLVAYHGILTGKTEPTWPQKLETYLMRWASRRPSTITDHYKAWPLPWANWLLNKKEGRALANRLRYLLQDDGLPLTDIEEWDQRFDLVMVAHSNGCCIVLDAIKRLAAYGIRTDRVLFIGGAIEESPARNGLLDLVKSGHLHRAEAWWSPQDGVIGLPFKWPYGNLGRRGWDLTDVPEQYLNAFPNRCFPGMGHTGYFHYNQVGETFRDIAFALGVPLRS